MSTPIGVSNRRLFSERKLLRRLANSNLDSVKILMKICVLLHKQKNQVVMNKPIYVGQSILDISKTFLYDFHYNVMQAKYVHEDCKLLFTDTDSLCYHVKTDDIYKDMQEIKDKFDFSAYPKNQLIKTIVQLLVK